MPLTIETNWREDERQVPLHPLREDEEKKGLFGGDKTSKTVPNSCKLQVDNDCL